jgi:uncharacterized protein
MSAQTDPVTLTLRRRPRQGQEADFEAKVRELVGLLETASGHRGIGVVRPVPGQRDYTIMARFESAESAAAWEQSPVRAEWLSRVAPLTDSETPIERQPGLEFWFTPPGSPVLRQPRRWKMTLLTLATLYPISLGFAALVAPLLGHWPLLLRTLLSAVTVVLVMTYLAMPLVTRRFSGWLRADDES